MLFTLQVKLKLAKPDKTTNKIYTNKDIHILLQFMNQIPTFKIRNLRKMEVFSQNDVTINFK